MRAGPRRIASLEQLQRVLKAGNSREALGRETNLIEKAPLEMAPGDIGGVREAIDRHPPPCARNGRDGKAYPRIERGGHDPSQQRRLHRIHGRARLATPIANVCQLPRKPGMHVVQPDRKSGQLMLRHAEQPGRAVRMKADTNYGDASHRAQQQT